MAAMQRLAASLDRIVEDLRATYIVTWALGSCSQRCGRAMTKRESFESLLDREFR